MNIYFEMGKTTMLPNYIKSFLVNTMNSMVYFLLESIDLLLLKLTRWA